MLEPSCGSHRPDPASRGSGARDVDAHAAVLALAADEAVAEDAGLIADDLELMLDVPFRRLPGSGDFRWMWLMRNAMGRPPHWTSVLLECVPGTLYIHPFGRCRSWDSSMDGRYSSPVRRRDRRGDRATTRDGRRRAGPGRSRSRARGEAGRRARPGRPDRGRHAAWDIERMVDGAYQRWGRLDVLFNNAGVIRGARCWTSPTTTGTA